MSYLADTLSIESVEELRDVANALDAHEAGHCMLEDYAHPSQTPRHVATAAHLMSETNLTAALLSEQLRSQIALLGG
ncbi:MAG: hypothetical protein LBB58_03465 [Cellulomonadaceae bacterium]|jgi:hypothetical protein|nr:hypothetical protein [Cellulomonadaceae bacterium]